jgi:hypothetical protein
MMVVTVLLCVAVLLEASVAQTFAVHLWLGNYQSASSDNVRKAYALPGWHGLGQ